MPESVSIHHEWRKKSNCSRLLVRFLAAGICILGVLLIILITVAIRGVTKELESPTLIIDGKFANTVTSCGYVQGLVENGSFAFLGIQYAVPPIGNRRWESSETHSSLDQCWNGTYKAIQRHKPCWQFYLNGSYDGSEDCLYLDVFTPKLYYESPIPVVVFVAGVSLNGGESSEIQPSSALAKEKNCVFVSVSIRRSVLGFLSLQMLSSSSPTLTSGNYGLSDLLTALKWVKYNIRHFSGNPNRVTLLGHQAGSSLLAVLLTSAYKNDLFHQLWLSGGLASNTLIDRETANKQNGEFLEYTECKSVECLRKASPEELLESVPYDWRTFHHELPKINQTEHQWLVADGNIIRKLSKEILSNVNTIPIVAGAPMHVDASSEMRMDLDWNNTGKFREYLDGQLGVQLASEAMRQYVRPNTNHWQQFASMLSDIRTICPLLKMSSKYFPSEKSYFYVVTHTNRSPMGNLATATTDIKAILGLHGSKSYKDKRYCENMSSMFYSFVRTGSLVDANFSLPEPSQKIFVVNDKITKMTHYVNCELWEQYGLIKQFDQSETSDQINE